MVHLLFLLAWLGPSLTLDDVKLNVSDADVHEIIASIVSRNPINREVLFIDMLYGSKASLCTDDNVLREMARSLTDLKDQRFAEDFATNPKYRLWLLDAVHELRFNYASKEQDLQLLAQHFESTSQTIGLSLNNVSQYKLLYLIRYLGTMRGRAIIVPTKGKGVSATQLLVLLQEEHNSRLDRQSAHQP